jgi:hypothetical protein
MTALGHLVTFARSAKNVGIVPDAVIGGLHNKQSLRALRGLRRRGQRRPEGLLVLHRN